MNNGNSQRIPPNQDNHWNTLLAAVALEIPFALTAIMVLAAGAPPIVFYTLVTVPAIIIATTLAAHALHPKLRQQPSPQEASQTMQNYLPSIRRHVSPTRPIDLTHAATIAATIAANLQPHSPAILTTALSALYHSAPNTPEHLQEFPEWRQLGRNINAAGSPKDFIPTAVSLLSRNPTQTQALHWAAEADRFLHSALRAQRAFLRVDFSHYPEDIASTAAEAAAFAVIDFQLHYHHLPKPSLAHVVLTALNNPEPKSEDQHANTQEDLPF